MKFRSAKIYVDFARPRGTFTRLGVFLLITGLVAASLTFLQHRAVTAELTAQEAKVEQLRSISHRSLASIGERERDTPEVRDQIKKANDVLAEMNIPWTELFRAVESAQTSDVAILTLQPDPRGRTVQINAQARDLGVVLDYMKRLQVTKLRDVVLATHEVKVREAGQPVEFAVVARWKEAQ
ncbi:MAG TPA: hypothetical protein VFA81_03530 [Burkholderiales bacterium]|nr:hypothetical protein [Burkholderiales bacterium]